MLMSLTASATKLSHCFKPVSNGRNQNRKQNVAFVVFSFSSVQCSVRDLVNRRHCNGRRPNGTFRGISDVRVGPVCVHSRSSIQCQWIALIEALAVATEPQATLTATETNPRRGDAFLGPQSAQAFTSKFQENIQRNETASLLSSSLNAFLVVTRSMPLAWRVLIWRCSTPNAHRAALHTAHTPQITIKYNSRSGINSSS